MRVLHLMNAPLTVDEVESGGKGINASGGWMAALLGRMLKDTDYSIACIAFGNVREVQVSKADRIVSYIVPGDLAGRSIKRALSLSCDLVKQWKPDLIHIHGTEAAYGLLTARNLVECPAVISLQGLLGPYSEWHHYFGNNSIMEVVRMHRLLEILVMRGQFAGFLNYRKMAKREREIIAGNKFFMGRTAWDKAYIETMNPTARYFYGGELLRDAFWQQKWSLAQAQRHRIVFTNAGHPRKGTETLLEAVKLLRRDFPDIQVAIAGTISRRNGYGRYIRNKIKELGHSAVELGPLNSEEMVIELINSHVFVSPSYIENSPNSVCEAQLVGMPVISTYTGGVPSLIEDGKTGIFFPIGDATMLASRLRQVFKSDSLASQLSVSARDVATKRHDPGVIFNDVDFAYKNILGMTT